MKKVTIKRSEWQRGQFFSKKFRDMFPGENGTNLWGENTECGCCLGHILFQAHRVSKKSMRGISSPSNLNKKTPLTEWSDGDLIEGDFSNRAMYINDKNPAQMPDRRRELELIELGKEYGYEIKFTD
jgi:hypothetical protein